MNDFLATQPQLESQSIQSRYVPLKAIETVLVQLDFKTVGNSVKSRPIHTIDMGSGPIKVLLWSQMHGNESTSTKGLLDVLCYLKQNTSMLEHFSLKIIPMLNPDGAAVFTRTNANNVDLNREAIHQSQPEAKVLIDLYYNFKPDYCFNLHDQRTIFGVNDNPCMLSFLSPAADEVKSITPAREKAMGVIGYIQNALQEHIPNQFGRYDDSFNPNCMGDFFTQQGTPTILFEAGQVGPDYARVETRKWFGFSILKALQCISLDLRMPSVYTNLPEVQKSFVDVLIKNFHYDNSVVDLALQYEEILKDEQLHFVPIVHNMGDLAGLNGHQTIDDFTEKIPFSAEITLGSDAVWLAKMLNLTQYSH